MTEQSNKSPDTKSHREGLLAKLRSTHWEDLDTDTIEKISTLIPESVDDNPATTLTESVTQTIQNTTDTSNSSLEQNPEALAKKILQKKDLEVMIFGTADGYNDPLVQTCDGEGGYNQKTINYADHGVRVFDSQRLRGLEEAEIETRKYNGSFYIRYNRPTRDFVNRNGYKSLLIIITPNAQKNTKNAQELVKLWNSLVTTEQLNMRAIVSDFDQSKLATERVLASIWKEIEQTLPPKQKAHLSFEGDRMVDPELFLENKDAWKKKYYSA